LAGFVDAVEGELLKVCLDAFAVIGDERVRHAKHFCNFELRSAVRDQIAVPEDIYHPVELFYLAPNRFIQIRKKIIDKTGSTDLGLSAATCRNGGIGDANDSLADLNGGTYFSSSNWALLTRTEDNKTGDSNFWTFSGSTRPNGTISGSFSLKSGLWNLYSKLVVVLKDGGSTTNKDIKWAAYLLPVDVYGPYSWSYDNRKQLSHATLYGVEGRRTSVPEPATLALLGLGLAAGGAALRRKRAS